IFSIYMMLMVGGIFVWLAAFKAFRPHTWAWARAVANYLLWVFFLSAVAGFFMNVITSSVADMATWDLAVDGAFPPSLGKMIFFSVLITYLLLKTADWSAALTGGSSMSPGIVTSGFSMASRAAGSVGAPGGRAAMGAAGRMGGAAWGAARGGAARAYSALKGLK
ncbi:MAG: type IV secretion system protein, partial [Deltaproteobacteria bacterium]|nr:type IV secretion system protein [Deltaproteobacteria bacterium]